MGFRKKEAVWGGNAIPNEETYNESETPEGAPALAAEFLLPSRVWRGVTKL